MYLVIVIFMFVWMDMNSSSKIQLIVKHLNKFVRMVRRTELVSQYAEFVLSKETEIAQNVFGGCTLIKITIY